MRELLQRIANQSISPSLFLAGMSVIYFTSLILLLAAAVKFLEHAAITTKIVRKVSDPFSTREMIICMAALFPSGFAASGKSK